MHASVHNPVRILASVAITGCALWVAGCGGPPNHTVQVVRNQVSYSVVGHGTADITWSGAPQGKAVHTTLPWHATAHLPATADPPVLTVVLGQNGGTATCSISVNGRRVGSSLVQGKFGRANCHAPSADADPQANE